MANPTLNIVHIDDSDEVCSVVKLTLEAAGHTVTSFTNGTDALAHLTTCSPAPDVILLDVTMHRMSGNEVLTQLKGNPKTRNIPVIFLSAHTLGTSLIDGKLQNEAAACERLGAIGFIKKENLQQLAQNISDLLAQHQAKAAASQPTSPTMLVSTAAIAALQPTTQHPITAAAVTNLR